MIKTEIMQKFATNRWMQPGWSRFGGMMRYFVGNPKFDITRQDWIDTIDYAISRGWIEDTGRKEPTGQVYNWRGKNAE